MSFTISDFLKDRFALPAQPAPLLMFVEIAIPDADPVRYVDCFSKEHLSAGKIPFNGYDWTPIEIYRGDLEENLEGQRAQMVLSVCDPIRTVGYFLRLHKGLVGQAVKLAITTLDHLSSPADALTVGFQIIASWTTDDPPVASLALGHFNLYELRFPRLVYDRAKCFNAYHERFTPGGLCTYPSNEFGPQEAYDYALIDTNAEHETRQGWRTQQALRAATFNANKTDAGKLRVTTASRYSEWGGDNRHGPNLFRLIAGDLDVHTLVSPVTGRAGWEAGILIQDEAPAAPDLEPGEPPPPAPASSWVFAGLREKSGGGSELFVKVTVANVTTTTAYSSVSHGRIRLSRVGDTITVYSRAADGDAWTQRQVVTTVTLPATARIGLAISSATDSTEAFGGTFDYLRFTAGGLPTCRRDFADCELHQNSVQFNGFREIPNDRGRY